MDPNYWAASLKYPPQGTSSRIDTMQPTLGSSGIGSNTLSAFEQMLFLERQRNALGFAAGFLTQQNLLSHAAYSAGASSGAYPGSALLDPAGSQSLYAQYAGALTQPYSTALSQPYAAAVLSKPVFPSSFSTYDSSSQSLSNCNQPSASGHWTGSSSSKSGSSVQKQSNCSDYGHQPSAAATTSRSATTSCATSMNNSSKTGYDQAMSEKGRYGQRMDSNQRMQDLDSRYYSLSNFMDSTVAVDDHRGASTSQVMPKRANQQIDESGSLMSRSSQKSSSNQITDSKSGSSRSDCNQRQQQAMSSNLERIQYNSSKAVDLTQFSKATDTGHHNHNKISSSELSMTNSSTQLRDQQYTDMNLSALSSGNRLTTSSRCRTSRDNDWILSTGQQYASSGTSSGDSGRSNNYEPVSPTSPAPLGFDSLYQSSNSTADNYASNFAGSSARAGFAYNSSSSASSGNNRTGSGSGGGGAGGGSKKSTESGVGVVLPMPQTRDTSSLLVYDAGSFDTGRYGGHGCSGSQSGLSSPYQNMNQSTPTNKLQDAAPSASTKSSSLTRKELALPPDPSQPIYLANIHGNIYVNQYTMLQPGVIGEHSLGDDYHSLSDFGIGQSSYPTIDPGVYQNMLDAGTYQDDAMCQARTTIAPEPVYKEPEAPSRSTMLVPGINDSDLNHLAAVDSNAKSAKRQTASSSVHQPVPQPPKSTPTSLSVVSKPKPANAFENSFLKFISGEKTETLQSLSTSTVRPRSTVPKNAASRGQAPATDVSSGTSHQADKTAVISDNSLNTGNDRIEPGSQSGRASKATNKRKEPDNDDGCFTNPACKASSCDVRDSDCDGANFATATQPSCKFPAKFSHKMHNRTQSVVVDNSNNMVVRPDQQSYPMASMMSAELTDVVVEDSCRRVLSQVVNLVS